MQIQFVYFHDTENGPQTMFVHYTSSTGEVVVTGTEGSRHIFVYEDLQLHGPGDLAETHRQAIAGRITANLGACFGGL